LIKKAFATAAVLVALPVVTQAQGLQYPGFYIGAIGGANWMLNNNFNSTLVIGGVGSGSATTTANWATGWAAGGMIGYDFVGPRVELEGMYRDNQGTLNLAGLSGTAGVDFNQTSVMANILYDFNAGGVIVPYIGAGAGVAFLTAGALGGQASSTQFAYQAMIGVGYNIDPTFRINLEGRYYGTTTPNFTSSGVVAGFPYTLTSSPTNNNISALLSLQVRFGAPAAAPPPPPAPAQAPSFMVFFDWDRSNLSAQALNTIKQAANTFKTKGNARITATGHTDRSGPENYNMALSLRRANAVKDALVREGVPATAIAVIGRGEANPLVPTADGVREPQNRRVEIVIQ
jgi:outer membrane protein OmpA-like peptidoglycan-associated protein/opacity protein-like surface antigen